MNKHLYQFIGKEPEIIKSKICCGCKQEKIINEFRKGTGKGGAQNLCIICQNEYNRLKYKQNKEKRKAQIIEWNNKNPEKLKEYRENYAIKHNQSHKRRNGKSKKIEETKSFIDSVPNF